MKYEFKIGDIITGIEDSPYGITNKLGTYKVLNIASNGMLYIKIITHDVHEEVRGFNDIVSPKWFRPVILTQESEMERLGYK